MPNSNKAKILQFVEKTALCKLIQIKLFSSFGNVKKIKSFYLHTLKVKEIKN